MNQLSYACLLTEMTNCHTVNHLLYRAVGDVNQLLITCSDHLRVLLIIYDNLFCWCQWGNNFRWHFTIREHYVANRTTVGGDSM